MTFVLCGINHKSAPIDVRERGTFAPDDLQALYASLHIKESLLLSTCNRTEMYGIVSDINQAINAFSESTGLTHEKLAPHLYIKTDEEALRHLLRVAIGLDSMMLGEPQIFGQLKKAFFEAQAHQAIHARLKFIFQFVFRTSKRIRHDSGIGRYPSSVAYTAVQRIAKHFPANQALTILLIGSGETAQLVAKYLAEKGTHQFMVASRTLEAAQKLASTLNGQAFNITELNTHLPKADVVITATTCPLPFVTPAIITDALIKRAGREMFMLDLALPRDIEPTVGELANVTLYNLDDLQEMVSEHQEQKEKAAQMAETLIAESLETYHQQLKLKQASKAIKDYRTRMSDIAQSERQRAETLLQQGQCQYDVLNEFSNRLINKLTHLPTIGLRLAALDRRDELLELAQYLFNHDQIIQTHEDIN